MTSSTQTSSHFPLSNAPALLCHQICLRFEEAWKDNSEPPKILDFVAQWPQQDIRPLLRELLALDIELRRAHTLSVTEADYSRLFPDQPELIRELFERTVTTAVPLADPSTLPAQLGTYRVIREIGRGGMGVVYEAIDDPLSRRIAIKVLPHSGLPNEQALARFRREARATAALGHPHIVPILQVSSPNEPPYYVMPFIEGHDLRHWVHQAATSGGDATTAALNPPPGDFIALARLGLAAADALAHAHRCGILHRDIKPANLLLDRSGNLWLTDFGCARAMDESTHLTQTGDLVGTLRYLPPEALQGQWTPQSDLYSLGLTLYEIFTLQPGFRTTDRWKLLDDLKHATIPSPRHWVPAIPRDLEAIVMRAIARRPADRYPDAAALANDLRLFVEGIPVSLPLRRRWPILGVALLMFLVTAGVALWVWWPKTSPLPDTQPTPDPVLSEQPAFPGLVPSLHALPDGRRWQLATTYAQHAFLSLAWAKDGRQFACGAGNGHIHLYSIEGGKCRLVRLLPAHEQMITALDWSVSEILASASTDGTMRLWHPDGRLVHEFPTDKSSILALALDPSGEILVWGNRDGRIVLSNIKANDQRILELGGLGQPRAIAWSPDGTIVAIAGTQGSVTLFNKAGEVETLLDAPGRVVSLAWAPDSKQLALTNETNQVFRWKRSGAKTDLLPFAGQRVAWMSDGRLAVVADHEVRLASPETGQARLLPRPGSSTPIRALATGAGGLVISDGEGRLEIWSHKEVQVATVEPIGSQIAWPLAWSADGKRLAVGAETVVFSQEGRMEAMLPISKALELSWTPDGRWLATSIPKTSTIQLVSPQGKLGARFPGQGPIAWNGTPPRLAFLDADRKELRVADARGVLLARHTLQPREGDLQNLRWDPRGRSVYAMNARGLFRWEVGAKNNFGSVATCAEGMFYSDATLRPDGQQLALLGTREVRFVNPAGKPVSVWENVPVPTARLRWSANGRWLASNGDDGNLYLRPINAPDWTVVRTANVPLLSLETSAAGHLAVVSISHTLYVWQPYPAPARFLWGAVFIGQQPIAFDASGTILAGPSELVDEHLVYLVENKQGGVDLLRRGEFEQLLASFR